MKQSYLDAFLEGLSNRAFALTADHFSPIERSPVTFYLHSRPPVSEPKQDLLTDEACRMDYLRESLLPVPSLLFPDNALGLYTGLDQEYEKSLKKKDSAYFSKYQSYLGDAGKYISQVCDDSGPLRGEAAVRTAHYDFMSVLFTTSFYHDAEALLTRVKYGLKQVPLMTDTGPHSVYRYDMDYFSTHTLGTPKRKDWLPYRSFERILYLHPLNAALLPDEKRFYYYWRQEFRNGHPIPVNPGYILLYLYELFGDLHTDPKAILQEILQVYSAYQATQLQDIWRMLIFWVLAAIQTFELPKELFLPFYALLNSSADQKYFYPYYLEAAIAGGQMKMDGYVISYFSEYDYTTGKLYELKDELVDQCMLEALDFCDDYFLAKNGKGLIESHQPDPVNVTAVMTYCPIKFIQKGKLVQVSQPIVRMIPFQTLSQVDRVITQITRETDRIMRQHFRIPGRLKNADIDPDLAAALKEHIVRFITGEPEEPEEPVQKTMDLDFDQIKKLRQQSDEVRESLRVEEPPAQTAAALPAQETAAPKNLTPTSDAVPAPEAAPAPADVPAQEMAEQQNPDPTPGAVPAPEEGQAPVGPLVLKWSEEQQQLLMEIKEQLRAPWITMLRQTHQSVNGLNCTPRRKDFCQIVNHRFQPVLQAPLLQKHRMEDKSEHLFFDERLWETIQPFLFPEFGPGPQSAKEPAAANPTPSVSSSDQPLQQDNASGEPTAAGGPTTTEPPTEQQNTPSVPSPSAAPVQPATAAGAQATEQTPDSASDPYETFIAGLSIVQRQALTVIAEQLFVNDRLMALADAEFTMADLLIDEINSAFMETFGDVLIDAYDAEPHLEEQYASEIRRLLYGQ